MTTRSTSHGDGCPTSSSTTASDEGRSVAVEPYTGLDDAFNNGIGLLPP